ncbi:MAG: hypothetical protein Q9174_007015, partial [Haloplaca sp. 1 TL-2023]
MSNTNINPSSSAPSDKQTHPLTEHKPVNKAGEKSLEEWKALHTQYGEIGKVAEEAFKAFSPTVVGKTGDDGTWTRKRSMGDAGLEEEKQ